MGRCQKGFHRQTRQPAEARWQLVKLVLQIGSKGPDVNRVQLRLHAVLRQKSMRGEIAVFVASSFASEPMPMKIYAAKLGTDAETQTCVRGIPQEKTHL